MAIDEEAVLPQPFPAKVPTPLHPLTTKTSISDAQVDGDQKSSRSWEDIRSLGDGDGVGCRSDTDTVSGRSPSFKETVLVDSTEFVVKLWQGWAEAGARWIDRPAGVEVSHSVMGGGEYLIL